jgi:4-amino-4-deoxy-L-arabinose transferase-like glycosyltransferase
MIDNLDLPSGLVLFILFAIVGSLLILGTRNNHQDLKFQVRLFLIGIAVRFAMSIVIYGFGLVKVLGDEDSSGFSRGIALQQEWSRRGVGLVELPSALLGAFEGQHLGYYYLVGAFYYVTDCPSRLPAAALNCFLGALTLIVTYRIAISLFSPWVAMRTAWFACFFPSMIVWSSQTLKEPVVIFLELSALYGCIRLKLSGFSLRYILICGLAIVLMIPFRFYAAYIAAAAVVLSLGLPQFGKRKLSIGALIGVLALLIPILMTSGILIQNEAEFEKFDIQQVQKFRKDVATGTGSGSRVKSKYDLSTPIGFTVGALDGGAHLLLAPFPWELGGGSSARMLLTLPELAVWYWLFFIGIAPGFWYVIRHRFNDIMPFLFFMLSLGLLYSLMFGNIGLIYRQRAQLLPWLFIIAAVGLEQRMLRRRAAQHYGVTIPLLVKAEKR